jgi:hypothetical protein
MAWGGARSGLVRRWHQRVYRALFRRELARYPLQVLEGVALYFPRPEAERVVAALTLLREADPRRFRRVQRHLPVLTTSREGTHYDATADAGCIDVALEGSAWLLAAALVHEATHAYLLKARGVPYEGRWRPWHERLCLREELCVLRRVVRYADWPTPEAAEYLAGMEAQHREALAREWWDVPLLEQLRTVRQRRQQEQAAS